MSLPRNLSRAALSLVSAVLLCVTVLTLDAAGRAHADTPTGFIPATTATTVVDPDRGGATAVSCPTVSFCMAVDRSGDATPYLDGRWGAAMHLDPEDVGDPDGVTTTDEALLSSVSCVSATFCATMDTDGNAFTWNGTSWTVARGAGGEIGGSGQYVSCVSASWCLAVDDDQATFWDGTSWSAFSQYRQPNGGVPGALDCPSTTSCVVIDTAGYADVFDGAQWTSASDPFPDGAALSCVSTSRCVAVSGQQYAIFDGAAWTAPAAVSPAHTDLYWARVSCVASGSCVAATYTGYVSTLAAGGWSAPTLVDTAQGVAAVSCASATACTTVDRYGYALRGSSVSASSWGAPVLFDHATGGSISISCASPTFCAAVDSNGNAFVGRSGVWSKPGYLDPHVQWRGIDCATESFCVAFGVTFGAGGVEFGALSVFDGSSWKPVDDLPLIGYLSCATASFCMGNDYLGDAVSWNGAHWTVTAGGLGGESEPISCPTSTFCLTQYARWDSGTWTSTYDQSIALPINAPLSCSSPTNCITFSSRALFTWDGTRWTYHQSYDFGLDNSVDCVDDSFCALGSTYGNASTWSGGQEGQQFAFAPDSASRADLSAITCPTEEFCAEAGNGRVFTWVRDEAPSVMDEPTDWVGVVGHLVTFRATAVASPNAQVQWQHSPDGQTWTDIVGATSTACTVKIATAGYYRAVFTNRAGTATSDVARLTISVAPRITSQPRSQRAVRGHRVTFTVRYTGSPTPVVQWQRSTDDKHWVNLDKPFAASYPVVAQATSWYRATVTDLAGSVHSAAAKLTVRAK